MALRERLASRVRYFTEGYDDFRSYENVVGRERVVLGRNKIPWSFTLRILGIQCCAIRDCDDDAACYDINRT